MKLQGIAIIFIMIAFPLILVLSYYVQMQIDTITLQTSYDNKLVDATYDAMAAFEINTANEDLSAAADSLRSIVNASVATFTNTLGTSLGLSNASKERIREYIPAMLFTLYDGYYIYAPTDVPKILEKTRPESLGSDVTISEGAAIVGEETPDSTPTSKEYYTETGGESTSLPSEGQAYGSLLYEKESGNYSTEIDLDGIDPTKMKQDYVLKSYMPYSATYVDGSNRATINYTLDNYMSISAQIDNVYYTKSGYYIDTTLLTSCTGISDWDTKGQDEIKEECELGNTISITIAGQNIQYSETLDFDGNKITSIEKYEQVLARLSDNDPTNTVYDMDRYRNLKVNLDNLKAITYYLTNTAFSKWVNDKLGFVSEATIQNSIVDNKNKDLYHEFDSLNITKIFENSYNPEDSDTLFSNHKYNVIKNSIQYNLNLAMSTYNEKYISDAEFKMPQLTDNQWKQITEKISIISFMQGLPCGTKIYTGYSVVSSTNNELTVIPEEIYYVNASDFNNEAAYYHRIDCPNPILGPDTISFKSKEVKYDKIYDKHTNQYNYDHKNLACYNCIVQNNYENNNTDIDSDGDIDNYLSLSDFIVNTTPERKKAYYVAVGKERQNLYKTTGYSKNEGISITGPGTSISWPANSEKAEVTIRVDAPSGIVGEIKVGGSGTGKMISTSTRSTQTVEIENNGNTGAITVDSVVIQVESIKYIYK